MLRYWQALVLAAACGIPLLAAQPPGTSIVIGATGGQLNGSGPDSYRIFTEYLAGAIAGYRFEVRSFDSIAQLQQAAAREELHFAILTPATYVEMAQQQDLRTLATVTQEVAGARLPWLAAAVFTRDDADAPRDLADVEGRSVVALARLAVGGWLAAAREWKDLGVEPEQDFRSLEFRFSFGELLQQVCSGATDIGVLSAQVLHRMRDECEFPLKVLQHPRVPPDPVYPAEHSSRLYPELAFVALGARSSEDLVVAMTQALLAVRPGSPAALAASVAGFTAPLSYESVEALMRELQVGSFADFGRFTLTEFLRQHSGEVSGVLLLFLGLLGLGFARSQQLNRRLQQSEQFRKLLFEQSSLPVVIVDHASFRFIDLNAAALRMYGFARVEELIGKTPLDVSAPLQKDGSVSCEVIRAVAERHAQPGADSFEWLHQRPDGSQWEAEVHLLPLEFGKQRLLQATMVDVTERNRIRDERTQFAQQRSHAQRLESLGRLSGAIAHDFNNLLTVINGYSELLLLSLDKQSREYRILLEIAQAGWRARDLTNQLLAFGRRQIGNVQPLDLNAMIVESGNMYRGLLGAQNQLQIDLDTRPCRVLADPGQLNQVLMNMLANARDAMPEGGECYISTSRRQVLEEEAAALGMKPGICVLLCVTDTGQGMSEQTREHIFEPFFSTKGDKGSGIGLATAYGIIRQCGGCISFLSEPGLGTTFSIYLPYTTEQAQPAAAPEPEEADLSAAAPYTVLVVEDQSDVRLYASSVLRSAGYKVLQAESGERALELLRSRDGRVDLLFTDVVMPGMNGRELAEICAREWPALRILFTSGYADDEVALHGVLQDRMAFIAKPYVPQHLLSRIKSTLATA